MSRTEHKKELVDDYGDMHQYYTIQMPAGKGWRLMLRLVRIAGRSIGLAVDSVDYSNLTAKSAEVESILDAGIDGAKIANALHSLAVQLIDEGGEVFLKELFEHTTRDGTELSQTFDVAYQGNYGELFSALYFVLEANFGPFFRRRLGGLLDGLSQFRSALIPQQQPSANG
jgi:hypothetical protein